MSFDTEIAKTEVPALPELYKFTAGGNSYHYTSYNQAVVFQGDTYVPASISRQEFTRERELSVTRVNIAAPLSDVTLLYLMSVPVDLVNAEIFRSFDDADFQKIFVGVIKSVSFKDGIAQAACETLSKLKRNKQPRVVYQSFCNHNLFDNGCALSETAFKVTVSVLVSGSTLQSADFDSYDDGYFAGGMVRFQNEAPRLITDHIGNTLTLQAPFSAALTSGGTVTALAGCDKSPVTCKEKFDNFDNFLGFPYIPSSNPVIFPFR